MSSVCLVVRHDLGCCCVSSFSWLLGYCTAENGADMFTAPTGCSLSGGVRARARRVYRRGWRRECHGSGRGCGVERLLDVNATSPMQPTIGRCIVSRWRPRVSQDTPGRCGDSVLKTPWMPRPPRNLRVLAGAAVGLKRLTWPMHARRPPVRQDESSGGARRGCRIAKYKARGGDRGARQRFSSAAVRALARAGLRGDRRRSRRGVCLRST